MAYYITSLKLTYENLQIKNKKLDNFLFVDPLELDKK